MDYVGHVFVPIFIFKGGLKEMPSWAAKQKDGDSPDSVFIPGRAGAQRCVDTRERGVTLSLARSFMYKGLIWF